jgi:hypothetical protein
MPIRIHVTDKQGNFKKEFKLRRVHRVWADRRRRAPSRPDKAQKYSTSQDLTNNHVWFLERETGKVVGQPWQHGRELRTVLRPANDRNRLEGQHLHGEVFAGERVQRFVPADSPRGQASRAARADSRPNTTTNDQLQLPTSKIGAWWLEVGVGAAMQSTCSHYHTSPVKERKLVTS